jgi:hypothetical protein
VRSETSNARLILLTTLLTALVSVGVCVASVLAPAPAGALPLVVVVCVGCPLFAAWEAPAALAAVRARRARGDALGRMRETLDRLPEIEHPLGL